MGSALVIVLSPSSRLRVRFDCNPPQRVKPPLYGSRRSIDNYIRDTRRIYHSLSITLFDSLDGRFVFVPKRATKVRVSLCKAFSEILRRTDCVPSTVFTLGSKADYYVTHHAIPRIAFCFRHAKARFCLPSEDANLCCLREKTSKERFALADARCKPCMRQTISDCVFILCTPVRFPGWLFHVLLRSYCESVRDSSQTFRRGFSKNAVGAMHSPYNRP